MTMLTRFGAFVMTAAVLSGAAAVLVVSIPKSASVGATTTPAVSESTVEPSPSGASMSLAPSPAATTAKPSAQSVAELTLAPTSSPYSCLDRFAEVDEDVDIANTAYYAQTVFIGHIIEVGVARWSTPDNTEPRGVIAPGSASIYTPVTMAVEEGIRATAAGDIVPIAVQGGEVGCDRVIYSNRPTNLVAGQTYAVFQIDPSLVPETSRLIAIWTVEDGLVRTPADGDLTPEQLAARIANAGYAPFPTSPGKAP